MALVALAGAREAVLLLFRPGQPNFFKLHKPRQYKQLLNLFGLRFPVREMQLFLGGQVLAEGRERTVGIFTTAPDIDPPAWWAQARRLRYVFVASPPNGRAPARHPRPLPEDVGQAGRLSPS